ncbi:hypothetical protein VC83_04024 [Pseudogymnoascus destructans]|uniref:RING-type domain-containing protein n=2 Tax=Pseudogymnoascus destructans TaxID=655981 RepID=L8FTW0_PSED2|nr:uncharacterized protein VC83_04024 [Pseudogymnoascus destructans]ELR04327.1 hypothetical protein GMDG_06709 [Pseudogymnoascus destructans 20631-21]OAF59798.1 hypothetical protein VC83_04024 [Pseudogymnoascus destructans]
MGCTSSVERPDGDMQPRRMLEVDELWNTSGQPPFVARPPPEMNSGPQVGRLTSNTHIRNPGEGSNFLNQNISLLPNQAPTAGIQHSPGTSFPQANQQYQDPWEARAETFYRFEHFHNLDTRRHGLDQIPQLQREIDLRAMMNAGKKTTTITKACSVCLDRFSGQDSVGTNFPYSCERFCGQVICITCLKDWFIDACKNESKMPPRCCCTVPLSAVSHLLAKDQVDLYKAKFEEWRTPDRFYCPVPTCSTFIPPRLIKEASRQNQIKQTSSEYLTPQPQNENLNLGNEQIPSLSSFHEQYFSKKDVDVKCTASVSPISTALSTTTCPKCSVSICTRCRLVQHPDAPCPQTDLDPLLAAQLDKWKIKRCPKCRAGVRRMFGCAHIECRCGAHFCFACLEPIKKCDGQCEDDDFDDDDNMSEDDLDSEDIDAHMAVNGTELDLGVEPYNPTVDTWSCNHSFKPIYKFNGYLSNGRILNPKNENDSSLDCQVCWKVLSPHLPPINTRNLGYNIEHLTPPTGLSTKPGWVPTTVDGEPAWMCMGKHLLCYGCPQDTMLDEKTSKYRCECSAFCLKCAKVVEGDNMQFAEGGEKKDTDLAYDCDCGMIVCGGCKVKLDDEMDGS